MRDYRIAFFTVDWNYELVEATLHGLKRFVDDHENVRLYAFDCFGKDQGTAKDHSEYAIFDLPDLTQFDGVLIEGNQIVLQSARDAIARRVAEIGIPAVTVDCPIEGCTMVGVDNRQAQYDITEHVICAHDARRLVYLTGIMDNGCPEAVDRLDGFWGACRDHGIPDSNVDVFYCTWRTSDGNDVAARWIGENRPLPDAFVCGNDEMALGVIEVLNEHGYQIPDDVIVVGFDNVASAELSSPRLSTIHRDYARLDYRAMEVLLDKIDGLETRSTVSFEHGLVCSESCGCNSAYRPSYIRDKYFHQTRFLKNFYTLQDQMAEDLFEASNLAELMDIVEQSQEIFGCDNVYLCVNGFYFDNYDKKQWTEDSEAFGSEMVLAACRREGFTADDRHQYARFPTSRLLPGNLMDEERFLVFYPLHYNTYSIGYVVMDGISEAAKLNLHKSIFSFLEIAIENVRKKGLLRQLNDVLDNLYVRDALTGLYNRFGYERFSQQTFDHFMERDGSAQILFVDMDDMKGINDRFGHEIGDDAIRTTAQVLRRACNADDFVMRYGGDEFLIIASPLNAELEEAIQRGVREANERRDHQYRLSLSIGVILAVIGEHRTLDQYLQSADILMYEKKKQRKGLN